MPKDKNYFQYNTERESETGSCILPVQRAMGRRDPFRLGPGERGPGECFADGSGKGLRDPF